MSLVLVLAGLHYEKKFETAESLRWGDVLNSEVHLRKLI
jgi:hypothetical protein